jgi:hypothetical protein
MNPKLFNDIVQFLTEHLGKDDDRRARVERALYGCRVLEQINWGGTTSTFAVNLVTTLVNFGECEPGTPALITLLESLKSQVGGNKQEAINRLIAEITAEKPQQIPTRPVIAASEPPPPVPQQVQIPPEDTASSPKSPEQSTSANTGNWFERLGCVAQVAIGIVGLVIALSCGYLTLPQETQQDLQRILGIQSQASATPTPTITSTTPPTAEPSTTLEPTQEPSPDAPPTIALCTVEAFNISPEPGEYPVGTVLTMYGRGSCRGNTRASRFNIDGEGYNEDAGAPEQAETWALTEGTHLICFAIAFGDWETGAKECATYVGIAEQTGSATLQLSREQNIFVVYIPQNPVDGLENVSFHYTSGSNTRTTRPLGRYPSFGLDFAALTQPACFVFRVQGDNTSLPMDCQSSGTLVFTQSLSNADVFWRDGFGQSLTLLVMQGETQIGLCGAGNASCEVNIGEAAAASG